MNLELESTLRAIQAARLLRERPEKRNRIIERLDEETKEHLRYVWDLHARPEQWLPPGEWTYWLVKAGRGWGKTRVGGETVRKWVRDFDMVNLIGATADDARDIMIEGESGILSICPNDERPRYLKSDRKLVWPNGATSLIFTADEPERLRGKQHKKLWADELASWRYPESWDQAMLGLRLGFNPQAVVTTTPRPTKLIRDLMANSACVVTEGTTYENRANLAKAFYDTIITKYEGTRLGRQELNGELLTDNPGALFTHARFDANRVKSAPDLVRIVVGVDPAVTNSATSDECGIVGAGIDGRSPPHFYILTDVSDILSVGDWGQRAVRTYQSLGADRIIGEANNGGDLVEMNIRNVEDGGRDVSYKKVHASKRKVTRAEPVSALDEQGRLHIVGSLPKLEDESCEYVPGITTESPNRMDAMVWAVTDLMGQNSLGMLGYLENLARQAEAEKKGGIQ